MDVLKCYGAARRLRIKLTDLNSPTRLKAALERLPAAVRSHNALDYRTVRGFLDDYDQESVAQLQGRITGHPVDSTHVGGHGHLALDAGGATLSLIGTQLELADADHVLALNLSTPQTDQLRPLLHPQWLGVADTFVRRFSVPGPPLLSPEGRYAVRQGVLTVSPDKRLHSRVRSVTPLEEATGQSLEPRFDLSLRWGEPDQQKRIVVPLDGGQFEALFGQVRRLEERERTVYRYRDQEVILDALPGHDLSGVAEIAFTSRKAADRFVFTQPADQWLRPVRDSWRKAP